MAWKLIARKHVMPGARYNYKPNEGSLRNAYRFISWHDGVWRYARSDGVVRRYRLGMESEGFIWVWDDAG